MAVAVGWAPPRAPPRVTKSHSLGYDVPGGTCCPPGRTVTAAKHGLTAGEQVTHRTDLSMPFDEHIPLGQSSLPDGKRQLLLEAFRAENVAEGEEASFHCAQLACRHG